MEKVLIDPDYTNNQFSTPYKILLWIFYPFRLLIIAISWIFWIVEYSYMLARNQDYTSKTSRNYAVLLLVIIFNYLLFTNDLPVTFSAFQKLAISVVSVLVCFGIIQLLNDGDVYHNS